MVLGAAPAGAHSPPGHIAFAEVRGGKPAIWTMNAFGTGLRRLAEGSHPAWTLTGTRIAFVRDGAVWVMGADGSAQRFLVRGAEPSWAPDGDRVVFTRAGILWVVAADGRGLRRLTPGSAPAWSPDASTIAFERGGSVWQVPAAGGKPRVLIRRASEPAWSQDARRLAFTSTRDRFGGREVYVADADGSHQRRLTRTRADERSPSWSTDGIWIAMASNRSGRYAIWLVSLRPPEVIRATVDRWTEVAPAWGL
jgi:Tol biopolymer transport system component